MTMGNDGESCTRVLQGATLERCNHKESETKCSSSRMPNRGRWHQRSPSFLRRNRAMVGRSVASVACWRRRPTRCGSRQSAHARDRGDGAKKEQHRFQENLVDDVLWCTYNVACARDTTSDPKTGPSDFFASGRSDRPSLHRSTHVSSAFDPQGQSHQLALRPTT